MVDWHAILEKHRGGMWRAVYRLLRNHDDALECCQDALLDAHQFTLKSTVTDFGPFLITLGTRRAIDRLRKQLSHRKFESSVEVVSEPADDINSPVQYALANELFDRLRQKVSELPNKQAEAFWLTCIEGFSIEETSNLMFITANEARVLVHRARGRLSILLTPSDSTTRKSNETGPA
jgi:RNA polymerase sigma-70 factor (ECF subfamily)